MLNNFRKTFVLVAVVATLSTGCRYSKKYENLAKAGDSYTDAVDTLLEQAKKLHIEASSEAILADDRISNQTAEQYQKNAAKDREIIQVINEIKNHNQLLKDYFEKLKELATDDAPERTKKEITGIATNLKKVSNNLKKTSFFPEESVLQRIGSLVIDSKIQGALREELEKRDRLILKELTIQQEMLKKLSEFMKVRVEIKRNAQEQRFVIRPLIQESNIQKEQDWIQQRVNILKSDNRVEQLEAASVALQEFKDIFKDSVEDKITVARLNNSLEDIDNFLALLEKTEQPEQPKANAGDK
ncbi:hypothetical protein Riv7116_2960 [Rivularia sp. PCC 7116]|uniref:hypothetical protein n=1 Tax=Rivularia sp. PCC 7116 TaxID=373994 RepID=UPI00029EFBEF|nr:hypothetical protein [Rivularia sp. PCC 7116]AFY55441.1 hypothetical protein Riv7116_2960 [Rivularia sp. PCC 7116]